MVRVTARRRQGFTHDVEIQGGHRLVIDEPEECRRQQPGPLPHPHRSAAALAACTAITTEMYADRKGWELGEVEVDVEMEYGDTPAAALVRRHAPHSRRDLTEDQRRAPPRDRRQVPGPPRSSPRAPRSRSPTGSSWVQ